MNAMMAGLNCFGLCKKTSGGDEQKREMQPSSGRLAKFFLNPIVVSVEAFAFGTIVDPLKQLACENSALLNCTLDHIGVGSLPWIGVLAASGVGGSMLFISYSCYCCNSEKSHYSWDSYTDDSGLLGDSQFDGSDGDSEIDPESESYTFSQPSTPAGQRLNSSKKDLNDRI